MPYRLKTTKGKILCALRKQTPEPVCGIIKSLMGLRQFSLRAREEIRGDWRLVTMIWNIKRIFTSASPAEQGGPIPAQN